MLVLAVYPHHAGAEKLHERQYDEGAKRRGRGVDHRFAVADANHEIHHHRHSREEDAARHSLTVEHEEERHVDEGGTGLLLCYDEYHRQHHDEACRREIPPAPYVEAVAAHQLGYGKGELGELRRLQAQRTEHEP